MAVFCEKMLFDLRSIRFLFDGTMLNPDATAESLAKENGDEIDAMLHQVGGARGLM